MYNFIDTHFHLDFYRDHKKIFEELNKKKIYTLCVTNQPEVFESCANIYGVSKYVKFAIGYNPKICSDTPFSKDSFLRNIVKTNYVGEVGLDFYSISEDIRKKQIDIFRYISNYASVNNKLMTVHCNKAEEELYSILKSNGNKKVIIHWFSGTEEWADRFIELGCYFSVNMNMLKNSKTKYIIQKLPVDRILVESDGPFSKVNGKRYNYNYLPLIYEELAQVINCHSINQIVFDNFKEILLL